MPLGVGRHRRAEIHGIRHFSRQVEANIPNKRVGYLVENVVMEKGEADHFAQLLDCNMVMLDPGPGRYLATKTLVAPSGLGSTPIQPTHWDAAQVDQDATVLSPPSRWPQAGHL